MGKTWDSGSIKVGDKIIVLDTKRPCNFNEDGKMDYLLGGKHVATVVELIHHPKEKRINYIYIDAEETRGFYRGKNNAWVIDLSECAIVNVSSSVQKGTYRGDI